jgi:hypothetical protein
MAKTQIADVVIPSNFEDYVFERTAETNAFFRSGIVTQVAGLAITDGGREVEMPFWQDLGSTEEDLDDSGSLTPAKITSDQQTARVQYLGKAWEINDLAKWIAGSDPTQNLVNMIGDFWGRVLNYRLMAALDGVFRVAGMSANKLNLAILGSGNTLTGSTFADGLQMLGDRKSALTNIAMHSAVHTALAQAGLISTQRDKDNNFDFDTFGGRRVTMDDSLPFNPAGAATGARAMSVDAASDEIRDAGNGFLTDGFAVGDVITTTDFTDAANNGTFTILEVVAGAITVEETGILQTEVAGTDETVTAIPTYTSYLFGAGSIGFGRGSVGSAAFESDRDILAGDNTYTSRSIVALHPGGTRFLSASVAGPGPTRAELELPANWSRVFEAKNIPIVQVRHRI